MELIEKISSEITQLQNNLFNPLYLLAFFVIITLMYGALKINTKVFEYLQNRQMEDRDYTKLEIKKLENKRILIMLTIVFVALFLLIKNFSVLTSILSIMSFMIMMSAKDQVSNIIIGISIKLPFLNTTIQEGQIIKLKNIGKSPLKILKVKIFKTLLLDLNTEEIISIQNTDLISNIIYHSPVKEFDIVSYEYIIDAEMFPVNEKPLTVYLSQITAEELATAKQTENSNKIHYDLKKIVGYIKHEYEYYPSIKNNLKIKYEFIDSKQIRVEIKMKRFFYEYKNYNEEYMKIYQELINS